MGNINNMGANWQFPVQPKDRVDIRINGVVIKDFTVDNYATVQVKWWIQLQKT